MRVSELLDRAVYDAHGNELGRIADLIAHPDPSGVPQVTAALVTPGRRGRLFGYERPAIKGPWMIERLAGWLHRGTRQIPWSDVRLSRSLPPK